MDNSSDDRSRHAPRNEPATVPSNGHSPRDVPAGAGGSPERPVDPPGPLTAAERSDPRTQSFSTPAAPNSPEPPKALRRVGDYELLEKIAHGGMGVVYRAWDPRLRRTVALKMIRVGQLATDEEVRRFYVEAEAAAQLDHPGIIPVLDVGEHDGDHYYVMGFVEGGSLARRIRERPLPPREAAAVVQHVAAAVHYAHQHGIIHRDLKPGNILLDAAGQPKVADFGLAKIVRDDSHLTVTGQVLGTPAYMPPVAWGPDGLLATAGHDRAVRLWDAATGQQTRAFEGLTAPVGDLAFSPDGRRLAACVGPRMHLWDTAMGEKVATVEGKGDEVHRLAFSPDGRWLATSEGDGWGRIREWATGRVQWTLGDHRMIVHGLAFSPDSRRLATVAIAEGVKVWDLLTGQQILTLSRQCDWCHDVAFSPDGRQLAVAVMRQCPIRPNSPPPHWEVLLWDARTITPDLRAQREADSLVRFLRFTKATLRPDLDITRAIGADPTIGEDVRRRALILAGPWQEGEDQGSHVPVPALRAGAPGRQQRFAGRPPGCRRSRSSLRTSRAHSEKGS
jgi:tRNA A-37 threonylcarbamoyl transferase component Bud32